MVSLPSITSFLSSVGTYSVPMISEFVNLVLFLAGLSVGGYVLYAIFNGLLSLFDHVGSFSSKYDKVTKYD